jgi:hypothetical protein
VSGAVYVYGVMPAGERTAISVAGVQDSEVRLVEHGDVAALASEVHGDALAAARELRAHWRVLDEASERATVLPVRFGTVMESEEAVREQLLEPNAERLGELLRRLAGCVQLSLKGDYDEELLLREVVRRSPGILELRDRLRSLPAEAGYYDRIKLGELVASEIGGRREADTQAALQRLEPLAESVKVEQPAHQNGAFNLAFLVRREAQDEFGAAVAALAEELSELVDLRFVGPLPPYSFADAELYGAGSPAWA